GRSQDAADHLRRQHAGDGRHQLRQADEAAARASLYPDHHADDRIAGEQKARGATGRRESLGGQAVSTQSAAARRRQANLALIRRKRGTHMAISTTSAEGADLRITVDGALTIYE